MEDHRIIMAGVLAGLVCGNVVLDDVYAINKSYPDFISDLEKVKAITTSNLANI
jgi:5-enolpyruvylshikimate-3-phosphate synthase